MSWFYISEGQVTGASPLALSDLILQSKGLSKVFSNSIEVVLLFIHKRTSMQRKIVKRWLGRESKSLLKWQRKVKFELKG